MKATDGPGWYEDGSLDVPLPLPLPKTVKKSVTAGVERLRKPITVAWALCPLHAHGERGTGLVRGAAHLIWITHYITIGKAAVPCRASGLALCDARPVKPVMRIKLTAKQASTDNGQRRAQCPHEYVYTPKPPSDG
jgi:hypothetical protein